MQSLEPCEERLGHLGETERRCGFRNERHHGVNCRRTVASLLISIFDRISFADGRLTFLMFSFMYPIVLVRRTNESTLLYTDTASEPLVVTGRCHDACHVKSYLSAVYQALWRSGDSRTYLIPHKQVQRAFKLKLGRAERSRDRRNRSDHNTFNTGPTDKVLDVWRQTEGHTFRRSANDRMTGGKA